MDACAALREAAAVTILRARRAYQKACHPLGVDDGLFEAAEAAPCPPCRFRRMSWCWARLIRRRG